MPLTLSSPKTPYSRRDNEVRWGATRKKLPTRKETRRMDLTIYHNPRCSKSRHTLQLLQEHGHDPKIVLYLDRRVTAKALADLLPKLEMRAMGLMRMNEPEFRQEKDKIEKLTEAEQIAWLADHPKVLQRPIVVSGSRAKIGRPPEAVLEILD